MDPIGVGTVVIVLVVGTAAGLWRARTNGRLRDVRAHTNGRPRDVRAHTNGRLRNVRAAKIVPDRAAVGVGAEAGATREPAGAGPAGGTEAPGGSEGERLDPVLLAGLGVEPGARGTLLQFSSAYCAPCRAVRRVSSEVADQIPGVRHVEVDAETHLDAVRALGIWRTPTLLILDGQGRVMKRATGVPTKPNLIAALQG
jgi:thiol-disulfide isomerase/thioredoxin